MSTRWTRPNSKKNLPTPLLQAGTRAAKSVRFAKRSPTEQSAGLQIDRRILNRSADDRIHSFQAGLKTELLEHAVIDRVTQQPWTDFMAMARYVCHMDSALNQMFRLQTLAKDKDASWRELVKRKRDTFWSLGASGSS